MFVGMMKQSKVPNGFLIIHNQVSRDSEIRGEHHEHHPLFKARSYEIQFKEKLYSSLLATSDMFQ
jgi:hypothetical protein